MFRGLQMHAVSGISFDGAYGVSKHAQTGIVIRTYVGACDTCRKEISNVLRSMTPVA